MDTQLRELERAAMQGDTEAQARLSRARDRAGLVYSLEELRQKQKEFDEFMKTEGRKTFEQLFKNFFAKHQDGCDGILWSQFTPHWNDGSPCKFGYRSFLEMGTLDYTAKGVSEASGSELDIALDELDSALASSEDVLLSVFGDHCEVIAKPDGLRREDYNDHH